MNYRHAFHAGSFADVVKHAVLVRILLHLREKPAAPPAGAGRSDRAGAEASRAGEWRAGTGGLLGASSGNAGPSQQARPARHAAALDDDARALLAPYLPAVAALNGGDRLAVYPGSP